MPSPALQVEAEYTSAGCNCTYNGFDFPTRNLIVYGANNALVFYDLEEEKVVRTSVAHGGRVNCVRTIKFPINEGGLVSCGSDGSVTLWGKGESDCDFSYEPLVTKELQSGSITVCDAIGQDSNTVLIGCITALSKVVILELNIREKNVEVVQEFDLKLSVALDLVFQKFEKPGTNIVLALGMDNGSVVLYGNGASTDDSSRRIQLEPKLTLKKHEDWVRCISFATYRDEILMAAGGEDSFISIWRFTASQIEVSEFEFQVHKFGEYNVVFDSIIMGHEGWINSLHWSTSDANQEGGLVSCSSDQSIIIWDKVDNMWSEKYRFGTIGGQIPGGFGAKCSGEYLAVCGFQGAIQIWQVGSGDEAWVLKPSVTGHFGPISDLDYNRGGQYIVTTSEDQTTRVHSPWGDNRWHEIGRPQIHGHDLFTAKVLGDYIISGAEEKILRAFQPTEVFARNLENASEIPVDFLEHVSPAASLPALGLSNQSEDTGNSENFDPTYYKTLNLNARLDEDFLRSQTLWPEVSKLYGHVYEICCIACSSTDPILASGSQASKQQFAAIILWSAENWKNLGEFRFHNLNVTDLEFSRKGDRLLSSSRDRTWALWQVIKNESYSLQLIESGNFHTRALWVGTWSPSDSFFVTGARDKKLAVWIRREDSEVTEPKKYEVAANQTFTAAVSAASINRNNLIAVGLESGTIHLYVFRNEKEMSQRLTVLQTLDNSEAHHNIIKRMRFNPADDNQLASAGADKFLRVYRIKMLEDA
ncbi:unnamed protein product [Allacma fusca]|uniref:Elongator complex protein 2 n=1 Tax=Allacma fusca TaxID=39272 RepID=A0A8J2K353_9HEXA|nr:unnamed protein product [Allacma fusca]